MKSFLSFLVISTLNIWFVEIKNNKFWCTRGRMRLRTSFGIWTKKIIWFLQQIICLQLKKRVLWIFILLVGLLLRPCLLLFFVNFLIFFFKLVWWISMFSVFFYWETFWLNWTLLLKMSLSVLKFYFQNWLTILSTFFSTITRAFYRNLPNI